VRLATLCRRTTLALFAAGLLATLSITVGMVAAYFELPSGGLPDPGLGPQPGKTVTATLTPDGRRAIAPAGAPQAVGRVVRAANRIAGKPYRWGGGHRRFQDSAYDCSGAVSFALHGAGLVWSPLDSRLFMRWGEPGQGGWITVYTNRRHAFAVIAGLRFDTSGPGDRGPRWRPSPRSVVGFTARHVPGL
jgi:cell wall-associated NlpC family hydrolase